MKYKTKETSRLTQTTQHKSEIRQKKKRPTQAKEITDRRPESKTQSECAGLLHETPHPLQRYRESDTAQPRLPDDDELTQKKCITQCFGLESEESVQQTFPVQKSENKTGLPDSLKSGAENMSGMNLDSVRVHTNSAKPASVGAYAYTQGTDIHVAPGQMKHLPHETWHVVQQMQGRVKPTTYVGGLPVNDNAGLEKEADNMGEKANKG